LAIEEIKQEYFHLSQYDLLEPAVKLIVLSPLLRLAEFYRPPFYIDTEKTVEVRSQNGESLVKRQIDILIFYPEFWVVVVEAKRTHLIVQFIERSWQIGSYQAFQEFEQQVLAN
jgi:hypothetical protein